MSWALGTMLIVSVLTPPIPASVQTAEASIVAPLPVDPRLAIAVASNAAIADVIETDVVETVDADPDTIVELPRFAAMGNFDHIVTRGEPVSPAPDASIDIETPSVKGDRFIVMIDPGHGGRDPGSKAANGLLEKELTRDIAERTRRFLGEIPDIEVLLTREGDTGLSRQKRVKRIRESGADLVVSLHFNHLPQPQVNLVESFYAGRENILESRELQREAGVNLHSADEDIDLGFTNGSKRFSTLIQNRILNEVRKDNLGTIDAGAKSDTLFVLTRSFTAGALIELTCISNPKEAERLTTESYKNELSAAIADAVRDYKDSLETRPLDALDV